MFATILVSLLAGLQAFQPSFRRFSTEEGLSQVSVLCITQDHKGRIWMGTGDGLNCFSGHEWKTFRHNDTLSIAGDEVNKLYTDTEGRIWVLTSSGVSICNPDSCSFRPFNPDIGEINACLDLRKDNPDSLFCAGKFLICSRRGLYETVPETGWINQIWRSPKSITAICRGQDCIYVLCSRAGIYRWDRNGISGFFLSDDFNLSRTILTDKDGSMWVDLGPGLLHIGADGRIIANYGLAEGLSSTMIRTMEFDSEGRLWVGTANNISVIHTDGSVQIVRHDNRSRESLSSSSVHCIYRDDSDGMWVGTFYGGANYWHPLRSAPHKIPLPAEIESSEAVIRSLRFDPHGRLWVGTSHSGTLIYDPSTSSATCLEKATHDKQEDRAVNAIYFDKNSGRALLGRSYCGIHIYSDRGLVHDARIDEWVFSIEPYGKDEYIVGTQHGVMVYDAAKDEHYLLASASSGGTRVYYSVADSACLWTGFKEYLSLSVLTRGTDGRLQASEKKVYSNIPMVQSIVFTPGKKWFASTTGLYCLDEASGNMTGMGVKDGWPTNLMRGIEKDDAGRLWVSTENGIVLYDPASGKTRILGSRDGLRSTKFNPYAHCKGPDGKLYFGGIAGIYALNPSNESFNPYCPTPVVTGIFANGSSVGWNGCSIALKYWHRSLDISLDVPDFISGQDFGIEYMMEGMDPDWRIADNSLKASYTNIPKGHHRFLVRARNSSGVYCASPCVVNISMQPVWYKTMLFEIISTLCLLIAVLAIFIRREKQSRSMMIAIRRKAREDISKVRAGSLASHPLTQKESEFIIRVLEIVDKNLSNEMFGVQELATALGMSRSNLNIRLKPITDLSPLDIIRKMRLEQAYTLLASKQYSVAEIASRTGFNSATYFATYFKKATGMSPSEWMSKA